ncbi:hypothetical protein NS2R_13960 [Pseudomonas oryzihabitans]|nr:hypothetical protein NS2R_13960 [Pseudomonas psychrotolerans]
MLSREVERPWRTLPFAPPWFARDLLRYPRTRSRASCRAAERAHRAPVRLAVSPATGHRRRRRDRDPDSRPAVDSG